MPFAASWDMKRILAVIGLVWTSATCAAPCADSLVAASLRHAYPAAVLSEAQPAHFELGGKVPLHGAVLACRTWPGSAELSLIAVSLAAADDTEPPEGGIDILAVDSASATLRARQHESGMVAGGNDPSVFRFAEFDGAPYRLASDRPAFGMRFKRGNNRMGENFLRLYLREGSKLDQLAEMVTGQAMNFPEFVGAETVRCEDMIDELLNAPDISRTVAIGTARHHGLADLLVSEVKTPHFLAQECDSTLRPVKRSYHLKYDGRRYVMPSGLKIVQ